MKRNGIHMGMVMLFWFVLGLLAVGIKAAVDWIMSFIAHY